MKSLLNFFKSLYTEDYKKIRPIWIFAAFLSVSVALYQLASISLFLSVFSANILGQAFIISGIISTIILTLLVYFQVQIPFSTISLFTLLFICIITVFIGLGLNTSGYENYIYIAFICNIPIQALCAFCSWGIFSRLFDTQQTARKLSRSLNYSLLIFSALTFLIAPFFLQKIPQLQVKHLILLSGVFFLISFIALVYIINRFKSLSSLKMNVQYIRAYNTTYDLIKNRYVVLLGIFSMISTIIVLWTDFLFFSVVDNRFTQLNKLVRFLGIFLGSITLIELIVKNIFHRRALRNYGLRLTLFILPILLTLSLLIALFVGIIYGHNALSNRFFLFFVMVCLCKFVQSIVQNGIENPTYKLYFLPINNALRFDIQAKVESVAKEWGYILGGLILLCFNKIPALRLVDHIYFLFLVLGASIFVIIKMYTEYKEVLKTTLDRQQDLIKNDKINYVSLSEKITNNIHQIELSELPKYLNILKILNPIIYQKAILSLLSNENEKIQKIALLQAHQLCLLLAIPLLDRIMKSKYFPVLDNAELIQYIYRKLRAAEFRLERLKYIEQLTQSKLVFERIFGALLSNYADEGMKVKLLTKLFGDPVYQVRYHAVAAAAESTSTDLYLKLIEKLQDPAYSNAATAALVARGENMLPILESAFYVTGQEEIVQLRIIQIYERLGSPLAVELLLKKINYSNRNVGAAALDAISKCGYNLDKEKSLLIKAELEEVCSVTTWNMSTYLDLQREKCADVLKEAMLAEIKANYDSIFKLLALLYDPKSVQLVKENIYSGDEEKAAFATELLDVFIAEESKGMLLPILHISSYEEKIHRLQNFFPTEAMNKAELLLNLVQRDYKWINRWTKACAIQELWETPNIEKIEIFLANIVNPDLLLRETASHALYKLKLDEFEKSVGRFKYKTKSFTIEETIPKIKYSETHTVPILRFDIVRFLSQMEYFKGIPGIVLAEIAKILELVQYKATDIIETYTSLEQLNYFIVCEGKVSLENTHEVIEIFDEKTFIHSFYFINEDEAKISLIAQTDCILYKINTYKMYELLSFYDDIALSLLNYKKVPTSQPTQIII